MYTLQAWRQKKIADYHSGVNMYLVFPFPFLHGLSAGALQFSCSPFFAIIPESYLGLLFYSFPNGKVELLAMVFLILSWLSGWLHSVMWPGAFHQHSCCVRNAEPWQQHFSPVSCFCSLSWVRIITSVGHCQIWLKSRRANRILNTSQKHSFVSCGVKCDKVGSEWYLL